MMQNLGHVVSKALVAVVVVSLLVGLAVVLVGPWPTSASPLAAPSNQPSADRVEVTSERTRTSKTFLNPNGTYTTEISAGSLHYQDSQGKWQDIDNTLVLTTVSGYDYQNTANSYQALVAGAAGGDALEVKQEGRSLRLLPIGSSAPDGSPNGAGITYTGAFLNSTADLRYLVGSDNVEVAVVLNGTQSNAFGFSMELSGLEPRLLPKGHISLDDPQSGKPVWTIKRPKLLDNKGAFSADAFYSLEKQQAGYTLTITASQQWLDSPDRAFPVVIDPSITIQPAQQDNYIQLGFPDTNWDGGDLVVGNVYDDVYRGLVKFDLSSIPANSRIDSASLGLYVWLDWYGASADFSVYPLTRAWSQTQSTWNDAATGTAWTNGGGDYDTGSGSTITITAGVNKWATWTTTGMVSNWYSGATSNYGMLVKGDDESTTDKAKCFLSTEFYWGHTTSERPKLDVNYTSVSKLGFTTPARTTTANVVSDVMTIQSQDSGGNSVNVSSSITVNLSSTSGNGTFYYDSGGVNPITWVTINSGTNSANFYYKDTTAGTPTITAAENPSQGWTDGTQPQTVNAAGAAKLVFTTEPQTLTAGVVSSTITVQRRDQFDNPNTTGSQITVTLSSNSTGTYIFRNDADTTDITSVPINNGSSSAIFKYKDNKAGGPTITVTSVPLTGATQQETVNAAGAAKLVFTTSTQTLTAGVLSNSITVQRQDQFDNPNTTDNQITVSLASNSTGTYIFRNDADTTDITSVPINNGSSSSSFKYKDNKAGGPTITVTSSPLNGVNQQETVNAAGAAKLVFTTSTQTLTAGVLSNSITVQRQDQFDNPNTTDSQITVSLTSDSTGTYVFRNEGDFIDITSVEIGGGSSSSSFKYKDNKAGGPTITVTSPPLNGANQQETVNAAGAAKVVFTTSPQTLTAGVTSSTITVQRQDQFNNPNTTDSQITVTLASNSTPGAYVFRDNADTANITSVPINNGSSSASFKYKDNKAGGPTITVTSGDLDGADQTETVNAAAAAKLAFAINPEYLYPDEMSQSMAFQVQDTYGNPRTVDTTTRVYLTTSASASGIFYLDSQGTTPIEYIDLPTGYYTAGFYYKDTQYGSPTLGASHSPWTEASQEIKVPGAPTNDRWYSGGMQSETYGVFAWISTPDSAPDMPSSQMFAAHWVNESSSSSWVQTGWVAGRDMTEAPWGFEGFFSKRYYEIVYPAEPTNVWILEWFDAQDWDSWGAYLVQWDGDEQEWWVSTDAEAEVSVRDSSLTAPLSAVARSEIYRVPDAEVDTSFYNVRYFDGGWYQFLPQWGLDVVFPYELVDESTENNTGWWVHGPEW